MSRTGSALAAMATLVVATVLPATPAAPARDDDEEIILRSEVDDRRAGEKTAEEVRAEIGVLDDPELTAYVERLGQRLVAHAPRRPFDYTFQVVDQDAPNAFALPGGFIYVSRGLLALTNSEDELANVLAHEIVHVASRHAAARQQVMNTLPGPLRWLAWRGIARYSREQEQEADRLGQGLAGVAGFDPAGMATFLRDLEFTERMQLGASRLPTFIDTHPLTRARFAEAGRRAQTISWQRRPGIASDRADYLRRLEGLVIGGAGAEGVFQGTRFLHADLDLTLRFPDGWEPHNTRRAVGAFAPKRDAVVFLEFQAEGEDAEQAYRDFLESEEGKTVRIRRLERVRIAGRPGVRAVGSATQGRGATVWLTFIVHGGSVYRLSGVAPSVSARRFEALYVSTARSFRALPPGLRDSIRENRLQIVRARAGESLQQLSARTENQWDAQQTAIVNDLFIDDRLEDGQLLKIAVAKRYAGEPSGPAVRGGE